MVRGLQRSRGCPSPHGANDSRCKLLARLRQFHNALAVPDEDAEAKLVFEIHNVLADAGLRGVEDFRDLRQIEVVLKRFTQDPNLLQVHSSGDPLPKSASIFGSDDKLIRYYWNRGGSVLVFMRRKVREPAVNNTSIFSIIFIDY